METSTVIAKQSLIHTFNEIVVQGRLLEIVKNKEKTGVAVEMKGFTNEGDEEERNFYVFTVVTEKLVKSPKNEPKMVPTYFKCVCFEESMEKIKLKMLPGKMVRVVGEMRTNSWEDTRYTNKDGEPVTKKDWQVTVNELMFVEPKAQNRMGQVITSGSFG